MATGPCTGGRLTVPLAVQLHLELSARIALYYISGTGMPLVRGSRLRENDGYSPRLLLDNPDTFTTGAIPFIPRRV